MHKFKDAKHREWEIVVTVGTAKRVRKALDMDLFKIHEENLGENLERLVDLLFVIVEPQATAQGVTDEDFGSSIDGDSLTQAWTALYDEITDFFRRWNPAHATMLRKSWEASEMLLSKATEAMESIHLPSASA